MNKGGNNRLARQINSFVISLNSQNVDAIAQHRLKKLDVILKEIAEGLNK